MSMEQEFLIWLLLCLCFIYAIFFCGESSEDDLL
jgi:hypothetical protein